MMRFAKMPRSALIVLFVVPIACGGEVDELRFKSDSLERDSMDDSASANAGTGEIVGAATAGTGGTAGYTRGGGYAGAQFVADASGLPTDKQSELASCGAGKRNLMQYDTDSCSAGTLCTPYCTSDAQCPSHPEAANAPRCEPERGSSPVCVLPCESDAECPSDMFCGLSDSGLRTCLFGDTIWAPHCDQYCAGTDRSDGTFDPNACGDGISCCEGMVCTPWQTCEVRSCLENAWACGDGLPPCCDGLSCVSGYCSP